MRPAFALAAAIGLALPGSGALAQTPPPGASSSWLQRRLETGLSQALGGTVHIGRVDVDWTALTATIGDVSISIPAEGAPPLTATMDEGRVKLAWSGLGGLAAGDIHITEVVARGATFSCSREWIEAPRTTEKKEAAAVAIQIDRLVVEDAKAEYLDGHQHVRIATNKMAFTGAWSTSRRLLVGEARADATVEAPLFSTPWTSAVRGGLRLGGGRLEIFNAHGEGPGAQGELNGNVTWGSGASFTAEGRLSADLAALSPYLAGNIGLAGTASGPIQIVYTSGVPIRVTVQAETQGFKIGPVVTDSARAAVTVRPGYLEVAGLEAKAYAGTFRGSLGLTFGQPARLHTDLTGQGVDLASLIALAGKPLPIASSADVTFAIDGEPGHAATWNGTAAFDAVPMEHPPAGRFPARGAGRVTFAGGHARIEADALSIAEAALRLRFDADLSAAPHAIKLEVAGTTRSARATQLATLGFLDALSVPRNRFAVEPVEGAGSVTASVATGRSTSFSVGLDLNDGSYSGEPFTHAALDLAAGEAEIDIRRLELSGSGADASGSARFDARTGALDGLDITARGVPIARALANAGVAPFADGTAELSLHGSREAGLFAAQGTFAARDVIIGREILDSIEAPLLIEGDRLMLQDVVARGAGFATRFGVVYDITNGVADVDLRSAAVDLAFNRTVAEAGLTAFGKIDTKGSLTIDKDGPSGTLDVVAHDLVLDTGRSGLREVRLGDLDGTGTLTPRGLDLSVRSMPKPAWTFDAFFGFAKELPLSAVLYFEDLIVGAGGELGESLDVRLKGQVQAEGALTAPRAMEINGVFDELAVRLGSRIVRSAEPFPLRLDEGRFVLGPSRFTGEAVDAQLSLKGSIDDGDVAGYLRGALDLSVASSLWSEIRGAGPVEIDATLGGRLDAPVLQGKVAVHDGRLRLIGYPQSLEAIDAEAQFAGQTLTLSKFHALQGGGEIQGAGHVDFHGVSPVAFHGAFDGVNVAAKFPEGFKGTYEGRITVDGSPKRATVGGHINVVRGLYAKDFDLGLFGGAHREFDASAESPFPRNIALDIDVVAPGNVWLRNDIAKIEAAGQVHIGGELARPEVTGRLSLVPGGTVRYRDVDYRIEYGTLELTDPKRINPYIDLRGQTRVAEYEIGLHVEGTMDKFEYELTSTPPLSSQDIISLLVTGRTLDTLSGSASAAAIPGDMAAYYFAGLLSATWGKQIQNSLGIDQLEVTPMLLKGNADPTARVTVGKQVSDSVKILFAQDIGTAQRQTYQVSWDVSRRVRLIAESDTEDGFGGELQYSRQFGGTPVGLRATPGSASAGESGEGPSTIAWVQIQSDDPVVRPDLVKSAKLRAGEPFDRGRMLQGGDRIRAALVKQGFLQATVRADTARTEGEKPTTAIVYRVAAGPRVSVEVVTADGKGKRGLRKTLQTFWKETPYTADFWDEATHALLEQLQEEGYYAADVTFHAEDAPSGRTVRILVDRGKPVRLKAVRFEGVAAIPQERIDKQMTSIKGKSARKRLLRPSVLAEDLASVRALYREEGFTRVRIGLPRITVAATGDSAEVDVAIQEGPRFAVGEVAFASEGGPEAEMRASTTLASGQTFSPRRLAEAEQSVKERLDALGYPDAAVESQVALSPPVADVTFDVVPGDQKHVGDIRITGNRVTKNRTIAQALTFGRGDLVSKQAFLKSQQQLYRTGLFSSVRLTIDPAEGEAGETAQRVTVAVEEAPPLSLGLGVGYDSSAGPRASVLVGYSNLGGRNVAIALAARVSGKENQEVLTLRRRSVFGNTIDSLASLLFDKSDETGFTESRKSASIRLEQRLKPRWIRYARYSIQQVQISDVTDAQEALDQIFKDKLSSLRLADVGLGLVRDTRDDAFSPTRGGYGSIEGSMFAKPIGSEATFAKLFLRGSWTVSLKYGNRLSTFLRIGASYPFSDTGIVPLSERFFAGGSNTLRGFATDSVGGLIVGGFNAGGQSLLVLNEEWHFPIWRSLRGELFVDAGNVYPTIADFNPRDLRSSAGTGLRLDTPIGAIRVEYGWKLDRMEGESPGEFVFAIGAVF